jgi:uncharacterized protein YkwD
MGSRTLTALKASVLLGACLLVIDPLAAGARGGGACRNANLRPTGSNQRSIDIATLCLIDQIRTAQGLRGLHANNALGKVASSQVISMVRSDYFADVRPTGQTPMSLVVNTRYRAHAADITVGQNIAWGTNSYATPAHIVSAWMASPPHREVMLDGEFHDAGVAAVPALPGVLHAGSHGAIYAVEFGVRHR